MQSNDENLYYALLSLLIAVGFVTFIVYMVHLVLKSPHPYPSIDPFDEKLDKVIVQIGKAETVEELTEIEDYSFNLLLDDYNETNKPKLVLLSEHFRLRRFELEGNVTEAMSVADRIEHFLLLNSADNEALRPYK